MNSGDQEIRETYEGLVGGNVSSKEAVRLIAQEEGMDVAEVRRIVGVTADGQGLSSIDWDDLFDRFVTNRPREGALALLHPLNWGWKRQVFFVLVVLVFLKSIVTLDGELFVGCLFWWLILAWAPPLMAQWARERHERWDSMTPEEKREARIEQLRRELQAAHIRIGAYRSRGDLSGASFAEGQARKIESALRELGA